MQSAMAANQAWTPGNNADWAIRCAWSRPLRQSSMVPEALDGLPPFKPNFAKSIARVFAGVYAFCSPPTGLRVCASSHSASTDYILKLGSRLPKDW